MYAQKTLMFYVKGKFNYKLIVYIISIFVFNEALNFIDHVLSSCGVILYKKMCWKEGGVKTYD
jgi:hypothetical protein